MADRTVTLTSAATEEAVAAALEQGRKLFAQPVTFMLGVAKTTQLPPEELPEICFAGRSNVGKSSLINALMGRKGVARTSNTPGRTQQLNFFNLADRLVVVDLPGYGFAKAPIDLVRSWNGLLKVYLRGRVRLRRVFVLVDSRHGLKRADEEMLKMLDETAVPYQVVLTKIDKISAPKLAARRAGLDEALRRHPAALPQIVATSAEKAIGIEELRAEAAALALSARARSD